MIIFLMYAIVTVYLGTGILYFASKRPGYSHIRHTISELGEDGAVNAIKVNFGLFLPVSLFLITIALVGEGMGFSKPLSLCIGIGYLLSALFPCDPGSPLWGSRKQSVHNLAGVIEYGGGIYFLYQQKAFLPGGGQMLSTLFLLLMISLMLLASPPGFKWRGLFQRIVEIILYGLLLWINYP